ncbi:MAG: DUF2974 domain-containing protein [Acidobacteria bacterium]|nr:DUF2974 domain-containing protein [Acidobacteriota bacterium]
MGAHENVKVPAQAAAECTANVPPACRKMGVCIPDANDLSFAESKSASDVAYDGEEGDVYRFPDGKEWRVDSLIENTQTGFRSVVMKPVDSSNDRVILAFAGTDTTDLAEFAKDMFYGNLPLTVGDQYEQAAATAKDLKAKYGDRLRLTGHSLGGGLSTYAAAMNGCLKSTGINSAPLHGNANGDVVAKRCSREFHFDYNTAWEFVHKLPGFNWGDAESVYGSGNIFDRHSLKNTAPCVAPPKKVKSGKSQGLKSMVERRRNRRAEQFEEARLQFEEARLNELDRQEQARLDKWHSEGGYDGPAPQPPPRPKKK